MVEVVLREADAAQAAVQDAERERLEFEAAWGSWLGQQLGTAMSQQLPRGWVPQPDPATGNIAFLNTRTGEDEGEEGLGGCKGGGEGEGMGGEGARGLLPQPESSSGNALPYSIHPAPPCPLPLLLLQVSCTPSTSWCSSCTPCSCPCTPPYFPSSLGSFHPAVQQQHGFVTACLLRSLRNP